MRSTPPWAAAACSSTPYTLAGSVTSAFNACAPDALTPSRVLCERATPVTAQPLPTSSSMTARPRLRAPNTTALRCLACVSLIEIPVAMW